MAKPNIVPETITLRSGWLVINTSTSSGGVSYERQYLSEDRDGERYNADYRTSKTIDHVTIVKEIDALIKSADYLCRQNCARTAAGWFADESALVKIRAGMTTLKSQATALNLTAQALGSRHRARISLATPYLDVSTPENAAEIARTIHETLTEIHAALRAGDLRDEKLDGKVTRRNTLKPAVARARNLDQLTVGIVGDIVKAALQHVETAKVRLKADLDAGKTPDVAGASLDLEPIESAIAWFVPGGIGGLIVAKLLVPMLVGVPPLTGAHRADLQRYADYYRGQEATYGANGWPMSIARAIDAALARIDALEALVTPEGLS